MQQNSVPYLRVFLPACFTFALCSQAFLASPVSLRSHVATPSIHVYFFQLQPLTVTVSESQH